MSTSQALSLHELEDAVDRLPRFPLAHLPTPLERLPRLTERLQGPQLWIKRDDCTGLALGGNKTRHNEFILGEALERQVDQFVWGAGVQSNNCRQTAAACAIAGIGCHLVLSRSKPGEVDIQGNLLLDHLFGATYEFVDAPVGPELDDVIAARAARFRELGKNVYLWDRHTVKPRAAVSYVTCLLEIMQQAAAENITPSAIYVCSAGSTGVGLALGAKALGWNVPVISVAPIIWPWDTRDDMAQIANQTAELLGIPTRLTRDNIDVTEDYIGPGYGEPSPACLEALTLLARTEGILLDPVYTAKALAGLIDHIRNSRFGVNDHVVFVHTGGTPALFAMNERLVAEVPRGEGWWG